MACLAGAEVRGLHSPSLETRPVQLFCQYILVRMCCRIMDCGILVFEVRLSSMVLEPFASRPRRDNHLQDVGILASLHDGFRHY
jgi:hypothetical protein